MSGPLPVSLSFSHFLNGLSINFSFVYHLPFNHKYENNHTWGSMLLGKLKTDLFTLHLF